jgi:hypothetical protein
MAAKITAIADKDLGHVFGAVLQTGVDAALPVAAVVADAGLTVRSGGDPCLDVPPEELKTYLVGDEGVLQQPVAYIVVNDSPVHKFTTLSIGALDSASGINFTPVTPAAVKGKAFLRRHGGSGTDVAAPVPLAAGAGVLPCTLTAGATYDVVLLVEGYPPAVATNKTAT